MGISKTFRKNGTKVTKYNRQTPNILRKHKKKVLKAKLKGLF